LILDFITATDGGGGVQSSSKIVTTNKPTPNFLQGGCPSCRPNISVRALQA